MNPLLFLLGLKNTLKIIFVSESLIFPGLTASRTASFRLGRIDGYACSNVVK